VTSKHLIVLGRSGFLHLIKDSVGAKNPSRNLDLFNWSNLTGNPAKARSGVVYVELKPLSRFKITREHRSPVNIFGQRCSLAPWHPQGAWFQPSILCGRSKIR